MKKWLATTAACFAVIIGFCSCTGREAPAGASREEPETPEPVVSRIPEPETGPAPAGAAEGEMETLAQTVPEQEAQRQYMDAVVRKNTAKFEQPGMGDFEKAKAAFDYMIETMTLVDPVGLDIWRIRGGFREPLPFVENRSLSILEFGVGKCEDYAAALTVLLRGMGLEAEYVPGLTYSTQGALVDHAWVVARIDGVWYHLDCQLEQNISRHGSIRYKYFMLGDATMSGSHRWGQNLINTRLLTAEQNEEIAESYIPPACPQDYPTPGRHAFAVAEEPDIPAIEAGIAEEFREYEAAHGPLEELELNIIPPVFALEGYGPQD